MAINRARNGLSIFGSPVVNGVAKSNAPFYSVIATLPWTGHFTPAPAQFSHSIAADSVYNHSFVPVSNVGVLVFIDDNDFGNGQRPVMQRVIYGAGTCALLVTLHWI
jgi:hypothetical protein